MHEEKSEEEILAERLQEHTTRGDTRADNGDFSGALGEYKKAIDIAPQSGARLTKLADSYAAMDVPHKALEMYQRALQSEEARSGVDMTEAHIGLGDMCRTMALSQAAVKSYTRAVRSRPKNAFIRWKLAVALTATGMYDQAKIQFEAILELSPDDAFYRFQFAELLMMMRRDEEALDSLREVVRLAPRDDYYYLRLGAALLKNFHTEEAVPQFARALTLKPKNASYRVLLDYARACNGEEDAIAIDVSMIELDSYDGDYVRRIMKLCQPYLVEEL